MSLYPIIEIDVATAEEGPTVILPSNLTIIPIDMTTVQMTSITLYQMSATQDFSLRAWISQWPDGMALSPGNYPILKWGIGFPIVLYVAGQTPPTDSFAVLVEPGVWNLNILNLTNENNIFGFQKTDLA